MSDIFLSDKIKYEKERAVGLNGDTWTAIQRIEVDVAEFIRRLKEELQEQLCLDCSTYVDDRLDKLAGEFK